MQNAVQGFKQDNAPARDISVITAEIKSIQQQANALALLYAVEIGRRLEEAKRALPYGAWGDWLKNEVDFSQSTANNFMRLYEEYGSAQISIFGASVDSQTFANLPYSKALQLLAVPADERESFAEEVGAADLSVKELKAAIEERDKARREAEKQKEINDLLNEKLEQAEAAAQEAQDRESDADEYKRQVEEYQELVKKERDAAAALREQLKKAEADPKIPKAKLDQIRKEADEAAKKEAEAKAQKALDEAKKKVEAAEAEAMKARLAEKMARESLEETQKKLKTASPEVAAFKALFDDMQSAAGRLHAMIEKIKETDPETAGKLSAALKAFGGTL